MGRSSNHLWQDCLSLFSSIFFRRPRDLPGMNIFFIKVSLAALLAFLREQNKQMYFLLPNNFFMSPEAIVKLLAGRLAIKVTEFSMFELTLLPFFDCNESNSENASF